MNHFSEIIFKRKYVPWWADQTDSQVFNLVGKQRPCVLEKVNSTQLVLINWFSDVE